MNIQNAAAKFQRLTQSVQRLLPAGLLVFGLAILVVAACLSTQINLLERMLHMEDDRRPADVIVVFSATLLSDCNAHPHAFMHEGYGAELWREGFSRSGKLVISGMYSQPPFSEAQCHAKLAKLIRVPEQALVMDNTSQTTYDNARHVREIMRAHGWKTAMLVTSDSHMRRALLTLTRQGIKAYPVQIPDYPPIHDAWLDPNRRANLQRLIYEYGALLKYKWYGYI